MSTYSDLRDTIQALADTKNDEMKVALGSTGSEVTIGGEKMDTGQGWNSQAAFRLMIEGTSDWLDDVLIDKLNELIGEYNQLREDYDNSTVPTSANAVTPL